MEIEELRVIWESQNDKPPYSVNEASLHAVLWQQRQKARSRWFRREILPAYIGALFMLAFLTFSGVIFYFNENTEAGQMTQWDAIVPLVAATLMLYYAISIYNGQAKQEQREDILTPTLREELDRALEQVEHQIGVRRRHLQRSVPVYAAAILAIWLMMRINGGPYDTLAWYVAGAFIILGLEVADQRRRIQSDLLPRKTTLESLRQKLANSGD